VDTRAENVSPEHTVVIPWTRSFAIGVVVAVVVILAASRGNVDRMTIGDGLLYRYVAAHLDITQGKLDPLVAHSGPSLRYGRIGLPAALWLASGGQPGLMKYAQPTIMVVSAGAIAIAASMLFPELGLGSALLPFLAIGLTLSVSGGYPEALVCAFGLWSLVAIRRQRWLAAAILLALAMFTRETSILFLAGAGLWLIRRREFRHAVVLASSVLPVMAWHVVVATRFGHLPVFDPWWRTGGFRPIPFSSIARVLTGYPSGARVIAFLHLALAALAVVFLVKRVSLLTLVAVVTALQLAVVPLPTWDYLGDSVRVFASFELMVIFAAAETRGTLAGVIRQPA